MLRFCSHFCYINTLVTFAYPLVSYLLFLFLFLLFINNTCTLVLYRVIFFKIIPSSIVYFLTLLFFTLPFPFPSLLLSSFLLSLSLSLSSLSSLLLSSGLGTQLMLLSTHCCVPIRAHSVASTRWRRLWPTQNTRFRYSHPPPRPHESSPRTVLWSPLLMHRRTTCLLFLPETLSLWMISTVVVV